MSNSSSINYLDLVITGSDSHEITYSTSYDKSEILFSDLDRFAEHVVKNHALEITADDSVDENGNIEVSIYFSGGHDLIVKMPESFVEDSWEDLSWVNQQEIAEKFAFEFHVKFRF